MNSDEKRLLAEKYHGEKTEGFFTDCSRLNNGEPLAYVIGYIPFLHTTVYLDSHPLIPRTETEFWIDKIITDIQKAHNVHTSGVKILDLCAGSGCIGIAVLQEIPTAVVDFVEIDTQHHSTIQKNISENKINPLRTRIFGGNLFEQITDTYDYILTNPPYINASLNRTPLSVTLHEPHIALFGGKNGLEIVTQILAFAPQHLKKTGTLVIEHEPEQTTYIHAYAAGYDLIAQTERDQYDIERYTVLIRN